MKLLTVLLLSVFSASAQTRPARDDCASLHGHELRHELIRHGPPDSNPAQNVDCPRKIVGGKSSVSPGKMFMAPEERIWATMPDHPVELAQPVQIPLSLTGAAVESIVYSQADASGGLVNQDRCTELGGGEARVIRDDGSVKTIELVPLQTGHVQIGFWVFFADGGFSQRAYTLDVVPSSKGLRRFYANSGFDIVEIVLDDPESQKSWLAPEVYYNQLKYPIYVRNSEHINFTVAQPASNPIIRIDENGMVHGIRQGVAMVTADFDGTKDLLCVEVTTKENASSGYRALHEKPR